MYWTFSSCPGCETPLTRSVLQLNVGSSAGGSHLYSPINPFSRASITWSEPLILSEIFTYPYRQHFILQYSGWIFLKKQMNSPQDIYAHCFGMKLRWSRWKDCVPNQFQCSSWAAPRQLLDASSSPCLTLSASSVHDQPKTWHDLFSYCSCSSFQIVSSMFKCLNFLDLCLQIPVGQLKWQDFVFWNCWYISHVS